MLLAIRFLTVWIVTATIATLAALSSILGSSVSAASTPVPTSARGAAAVPIGPAYLLPGGLELPHGTAAIGPATDSVSEHGIRRWETRVDLGQVTGAQALASLADQLRRPGWEIQGGSHDFVAVRLHDGRWELVAARWPAPHQTSEHSLGIGIGSRPA